MYVLYLYHSIFRTLELLLMFYKLYNSSFICGNQCFMAVLKYNKLLLALTFS